MKTTPIRVLIVDDSAVVRKTITELLSGDPGIEVMATAGDPYIAAERISHEVPDVILLDIEMPHMDGLTFLKKLMAQHPIPVVVCSSLARAGSETMMKAIEYGAVDVVTKPMVGTKEFLQESRDRLRAVVHTASQTRLRHLEVAPKLTADAMISAPTSHAMIETTDKVVLIGASTGGTEALSQVLRALPADSPGIVIVQHMPEKFTTAFAERLNTLCQVTVMEASDRDNVIRGRVLIAPGNRHTLLKRSGARYYVEVKDGPAVCRHRPSVDVLFRSAARYAGRNAVGILLTGMGDDGARGLLEMKQSGATTFAQDEKTSVVFGMPQEAIRRGAVDRVLPLPSVAGALLAACQSATAEHSR